MTTERVYRTTTRVGPGHRIEFDAPELAEGERVEVFVVAQGLGPTRPGTFLEMIDGFPEGPRSARSWEEVEANIQSERDAWDR